MKIPAKIIIASSSLGFLNALYLTYLFFMKTYYGDKSASVCDINQTLSCSSVITSPFGKLFGLPICTIAMFVYPAILILAVFALKKAKSRNYYYAISILSAMGLMMNVIYLYNEYTFVGAICVLCTTCLVMILTNLVASIVGYSKAK
jgi:uncharacterized membrane protein